MSIRTETNGSSDNLCFSFIMKYHFYRLPKIFDKLFLQICLLLSYDMLQSKNISYEKPLLRMIQMLTHDYFFYLLK